MQPLRPRADRRRILGGEAAAIACGGAPIGLGTDFGGSIRLPAFFNGIFGHKPSAGMVPNAGHYPPALDEADRIVRTGPLARRAEDLMPVLRVLAGDGHARGESRLGNGAMSRSRTSASSWPSARRSGRSAGS